MEDKSQIRTAAAASTLEVPPEFQQALEEDSQAMTNFEAMPPSHRQEYLAWIADAKKPETRTARIAKALDMIRTKKRQR